MPCDAQQTHNVIVPDATRVYFVPQIASQTSWNMQSFSNDRAASAYNASDPFPATEYDERYQPFVYAYWKQQPFA